MVTEHSCLHNGHIWIEANGELYVRHRDRTGTVDVSCPYCDTIASLTAHGKATAPFTEEAVKAMAVLRKDRTLRDKVDAKKVAFAITSAPAKNPK